MQGFGLFQTRYRPVAPTSILECNLWERSAPRPSFLLYRAQPDMKFLVAVVADDQHQHLHD
jgi:hypothetical protein